MPDRSDLFGFENEVTDLLGRTVEKNLTCLNYNDSQNDLSRLFFIQN